MNILLAVTGSISCYKSFDLIRLFVKAGHQVRVVLSAGATSFLKEDLYRYLGAEEVYLATDDFNAQYYRPQDGRVLHIELAKWADLFLVAPLSANTLAKFCQGHAGDLMQSIFLALPNSTPKLFCPAMNTQMLSHPFVGQNLDQLKTLPASVVLPTQNGELACGDVGAGKLLDVDQIFHVTETYLPHDPPVPSKHVLITTGATVAPLDTVRYLTNASSGKTGFHLAKEALKLGHQVSLVAGIHATADLDLLVNHPRLTLKRVTTNQHMKDAISKLFSSCDIYISSAAIGDFEFDAHNGKLKKAEMEDSLPIKKTHDILQGVIDQKGEHQQIVGFAAETTLTDQIMREKMNRKPVDLLIATQVDNGLTSSQETQGFANDHAHYRFMTKGYATHPLIQLSKEQLATSIFQQLSRENECD